LYRLAFDRCRRAEGVGRHRLVGHGLNRPLRHKPEVDRPGHSVIDHRTYVICSDGDLQEGITAKAASLAGHLRLGRLIVLYDDNDVQLDGPTSMAWSEDVPARFDAYGWHTQRVADGNDIEAIAAAIEAARADERPSLIAVRTVIGYGSTNKAGSHKAHGAPLGADEVRLTKEAYGLDPDRTFDIPAEVLGHMREAADHGEELVAAWERQLLAYAAEHPALAAELERRLTRQLPADWEAGLPWYAPEDGGVATRNASKNALEGLKDRLPELFGGSADLSESNLTDLAGGGALTAEATGRNIRFGVREHAMGGIANGLAYHGGLLPFVGTFLNFSDYMRGSVRLAALSGLQVVYVWTHDSVGLGEDGPTHQPVEHLAMLRASPNLMVFRPADTVETAEAWEIALTSKTTPSVLALTRQNLPTVRTAHTGTNLTARGAYVLAEATAKRQAILMATGSEIEIALAARAALEAEGIGTRVVSMPCWELFEEQDEAYRRKVLPAGPVRVAVEAALRFGWDRWLFGERGRREKSGFVGMHGFGASAPAEVLYREFGITAEAVAAKAKKLIAGEWEPDPRA
jgi:transketolase